jgi:hypothetical protein
VDLGRASPGERRAAGRARRTGTRRSAHRAWEPAAGRRDPVEVIIDVSKGRLADLVPLRDRRMLASSGTAVPLCGDAHLLGFGVFASPEGSLVFDRNDVDETFPGPSSRT